MVAGRKPTHTREQFVAAAITLADSKGLPAVSSRAVAEKVGASATAVYRYFADREDLIEAMRDSILAELSIAVDEEDPRANLISAAMAYRALARAHPCLGELAALPARQATGLNIVAAFLLGQLVALGITDRLLPRAYRQLESFVIGTTMYDYSGAPQHLNQRLARMQLMKDPLINRMNKSIKAVEDENERAFEASFRTLLDALIAESSDQH